jgi:hypothetical protein
MLGDKTMYDIQNHLMIMATDMTVKDRPSGWCFTNVNSPIAGMSQKEQESKRKFMEFNQKTPLY